MSLLVFKPWIARIAEGVAEDERDSFALTKIGEPVQGEETLAAEGEIGGAKRRQGLEEGLRPAGEIAVQERLALAIEDADVQRPRVVACMSFNSVQRQAGCGRLPLNS